MIKVETQREQLEQLEFYYNEHNNQDTCLYNYNKPLQAKLLKHS